MCDSRAPKTRSRGRNFTLRNTKIMKEKNNTIIFVVFLNSVQKSFIPKIRPLIEYSSRELATSLHALAIQLRLKYLVPEVVCLDPYERSQE